MTRVAVILSSLLFTVAAFGQDESASTTPAPDYSRDTLVRLFAEIEIEERESRIQHSFGRVDFRALGMRWRVGYLPFFMPLPGSQPWVNGERWPDPFRLTGTEIASPPRTWKQTRDMSAELRRIERKVRKATIVAKPE